jgi:hypothetical protein
MNKSRVRDLKIFLLNFLTRLRSLKACGNKRTLIDTSCHTFTMWTKPGITTTSPTWRILSSSICGVAITMSKRQCARLIQTRSITWSCSSHLSWKHASTSPNKPRKPLRTAFPAICSKKSSIRVTLAKRLCSISTRTISSSSLWKSDQKVNSLKEI